MQEFEEVYSAYAKELEISNRLDYDDLLLHCQQLLAEHPGCVVNVEAVLIDEFQDTNIVQYELMKLFAARNRRITIVGDPDQSIYGFRSAEIKNLGRMKEAYPETVTIYLEENYRSCGAILRAAQDIIEQDVLRPQKTLQATHSYGSLPVLRKLPSSKAEAVWIVLEIQRAAVMSGKMLKHSDFSILLRSAHLSRQIESELGKAGIPYQMVGGFRFYDRLEVKLLLDYLKVVYQQTNNEAVMAIINVPSRKIGDKSKKELQDEASSKGYSLFEWSRRVARGERASAVRLNSSAQQNLGSFVSLILACRDMLDGRNSAADAPKRVLNYLIKKLSLKQYLEDNYSEDSESRWANVEELLVQAQDLASAFHRNLEDDALPQVDGFQQQQDQGGSAALSQFLANISLSSQADALEEDAIQQRVTISTIHAAKGLEWPVVFIPALYDGSIPHSRAEDTDEERRLLYVAMTRAQALLNLSWPLQQSSHEETALSSFVTQRSVDRLFQDTGPDYKYDLLETIARTLRRPMSSPSVILKDKESLRSTLDDLWPASGERGELDASLWNNGFGSTQPKRNALDNCTVFDGDLVNGPQRVPDTPTAPPGGSTDVFTGFTTASAHLKAQPAPAAPIVIGSGSPKKGKRLKRASSDQPSIANFFGPRPRCPEPTADSPAVLPRKLTTSTSASSVLPSFVKESKPYIPLGLSSHRLMTAATSKRPRTVLEENPNPKAHAFLSSSPPPQDKREQAVQTEEKATFRPVTTFHKTSMAPFHPGSAPESGIGVVKKTYGVRRTMSGWENRTNK